MPKIRRRPPHAPARAPLRRALWQAKRAVSKRERERDAKDGCELDFTEQPTADHEVEALLEPEEEGA